MIKLESVDHKPDGRKKRQIRVNFSYLGLI